MREIDRRYAQEAERPGIGYLLEQARVNRGVSLEEAAQATRIRRDYLEKLESDGPLYDAGAHLRARIHQDIRQLSGPRRR